MNSALIEELPIHQRPLNVLPQPASPFYSGHFPAELREQIFQYSLSEDESTDPLLIYPSTFSRPGYRAKWTISISLLLTCRRIYLETYYLPLRSKEHVFWHSPETGPPARHGWYDRFGHEMEDRLFTGLKPWQAKLVTEMHLFTQMFWLEQSFSKLCKQDYMQSIERLKISIRKTDWWWNESSNPLSINPNRGIGGGATHPSQMKEDIKASKQGKVVPWNINGWGGAFSQLGSLKELTIEFETGDDQRGELLSIMDWAKTWRFPLKERCVLSTGNSKMTTNSWDAPAWFWSRSCPHCGGAPECRPTDLNTPPDCVERTRRKLSRTGPLCWIYTLKWTVATDSDCLI